MSRPNASSGLAVFVLTRFSILSSRKGHSWHNLQKTHRTWVRKLLGIPDKVPSLDKKRRYLFDEDRLRYRLKTFKKFTLPSLQNQVDKDFRHLVLTSNELLAAARNGPEYLAGRYDFEIIDVPLEARFEDIPASRTELTSLDAERVATVRLGDDDALGSTIVSGIRSVDPGEHDDVILTWPNGLMLTDHGDYRHAACRVETPSIACGLTRARTANSVTPTIHSAGNHRHLPRSFPFKTFADTDAFLMAYHSDNISLRESRRKEIALTEELRDDIRSRFGVDL